MLGKGVNRADINIATVDRGTIETSVNATGKVVPAFEEIINSPISTRIVEVYCRAGDSVHEGTPLLRLDLMSAETDVNNQADQRTMKQVEVENQRLDDHTAISNLEMQIKVKEMAVSRLAVEVENERRLDSLGSGTGDQVRQAELAYNTGRLELEQLRQQLDNETKTRAGRMRMAELELNILEKNLYEKQRTLDQARICSPRSAILTYINNQIGQQVGQGERVAVISDLSHFKIEGEIADGYSDRVKPGSHVVVRIGREKLQGQVTNVTPLSKNGVINFIVQMDQDDHPRLRSGLKTDVYVMSDIHDDAMRLPVGPYFKGPGVYELFVEEDGQLVKHSVRLGDSNYDYVEVVEGLKPGDKVVTTDMSEYKTSNKLKLK